MLEIGLCMFEAEMPYKNEWHSPDRRDCIKAIAVPGGADD